MEKQSNKEELQLMIMPERPTKSTNVEYLWRKSKRKKKVKQKQAWNCLDVAWRHAPYLSTGGKGRGG